MSAAPAYWPITAVIPRHPIEIIRNLDINCRTLIAFSLD
jgi:hypothetical protein